MGVGSNAEMDPSSGDATDSTAAATEGAFSLSEATKMRVAGGFAAVAF